MWLGGAAVATIRVDVRPDMLRWAIARAGDVGAALREKVPQLNDWIAGDAKPTLKQLEDFARAARVPIGYLFLATPPEEKLPIRDLRTMGSKGVRRPSPDLLDVIHLCQRRQDWYRDYAKEVGETERAFVGSASWDSDPDEIAAEMRRTIDFGTPSRRLYQSPADATRAFVEKVEGIGVLVMISGVVKNITKRTLDPEEFRGFALADPLAPLIFVNAADTKPAQTFTLAHELAHIWLGVSALSDTGLRGGGNSGIESWCNRVAAEFLVPLSELKGMAIGDPLSHLDEYRRTFQVSRAVILRRLLDAGLISREQFNTHYGIVNQPPAATKPASGGDFYNTLPVRASKRFVRALVESTVEGRTLYRDAFQMLGIRSVKTFKGIGKKVGGLP